MFHVLQYVPVSPREKFRLHNGQLVLLGAKQTPPPFQSPTRWEWASEVFEVAVGAVGGWGGGGGVSRWLLILQDEAPGPWWRESGPPFCGLAPLGGGGGSVRGPARWGSAVGWAGWSQEAGVQGRSHRRARQVLWQRHVRQPCFCCAVTFSRFSQRKRTTATAASHSLIGPRSCDQDCLYPG